VPRPASFRDRRCRISSRCVRLGLLAALVAAGSVVATRAHVVPPERLHPVAESYRLMGFLLALNPIDWDRVEAASATIGERLLALEPGAGGAYRTAIAERIATLRSAEGTGLSSPAERKAAASEILDRSTRAVVTILERHLRAARAALGDYALATHHLEQARRIWAAFEHEIKATDRRAFLRLGQCWLELVEALGNPGVLGLGAVAADPAAFDEEARELVDYLDLGYGGEILRPARGSLLPLPGHSPTFDPDALVPPKLPPGSELNKQLPRPRQILNMAARGVDESETALIALGDMAFDSSFVFGEPARSLAISCNTCHNKGVTNPGLFIPGLSARRGGLDVSNNYFAPHASNGHLDPVDIPDLRGIRFTAPYGRNGRFDSLREFTRNVIVNEFNGPEPDPVLLDALVAYMLEFDFLPNPSLAPDGSLAAGAPEPAQRGAAIFRRPFEQLGGRSCATCHVPSDSFLDRKRHDIGTVAGAEAHSRDRALDTPTLLGSRHTAPYFHDGSAPTLRAVVEWFDRSYALALGERAISDLTAYLETIGDGVQPYEETTFTLEAEMEEFSFFLSAFEFLAARDERELLDVTFRTVAQEIRAHKWDVQDAAQLPVLDRLAELMDAAVAANGRGDGAAVAARVADYRALYRQNAEHLR